MGKEYAGQASVILWLVFLQPKDFGGRKPGQHRVSQCTDRLFRASQFFSDLVALGNGRRVAPQFRRTDDFAVSVERNEAVLLSADADRLDFGSHGFGLP